MEKHYFERISGSFTGTGTADATYRYPGKPDVTVAPKAGDIGPFGGFYGIEAQIEVDATPGGTTPTLDVKLQGSLDGTNWFDILTFTQITTSAAVERKMAIRTASVALGTMLRWESSVGSAAGNPVYVCVFDLLLWNT